MVRLPVYLLLLLAQLDTSEHGDLSDSGFLVVLGIAQDAGYPQAQCKRSCCEAAWNQPENHRMVSCLAYVDNAQKEYWLFDATPDFKKQTHLIESRWEVKLAGVFLTHAHIGHYTGLIHLGREVTGSNEVPVYAMPRMKAFLESNGPWDQLVRLKNIQLIELRPDSSVYLSPDTWVTPFEVPHRDEYSETVGYRINGADKQSIFIPDIDKWQKWERDLVQEVQSVDLAFIDGSFMKDGEIKGRDMASIPHPFIVESMALLNDLPSVEKEKVHFIHFNHTNPILQEGIEKDSVLNQGFNIAEEGMVFRF